MASFVDFQSSSHYTFKVYKSHFGVLVGPTERSGQSSDILHCGSHPKTVSYKLIPCKDYQYMTEMNDQIGEFNLDAKQIDVISDHSCHSNLETSI